MAKTNRVSPPPDGSRCIAKSRQTHERCKNWRVEGKEVCIHHGGGSVSGIAHGNAKHLGYSGRLRIPLAALYEEAMQDAQILSLRNEIGVIRARLFEQSALLGTEDGQTKFDSLLESLRRAIDSEWARQRDLSQMMTAQQAEALVGAVLLIIMKRVKDRRTRELIQTDMLDLKVKRGLQGKGQAPTVQGHAVVVSYEELPDGSTGEEGG